MSATGSKCPSCGESAVVVDEVESRAVCECCGVIVEDNFLVNSLGFGESLGLSGNYNSLPTEFYKRNTTSITEGRKLGVRRVKEMGQALSLFPVMIEEAVGLFEEVYASGRIHSHKNVVKETVSACCVYIVGRKHNWPLTKTAIANLAQRSLAEVVFWTREVTKLLGIEITSPDIEELIPVQLTNWGLPSSLSPTAMKVIEVTKSTWVSEGKGVNNVIQAAVYLAYEADRCKQGKRGVLTPNSFSTEIKVPKACTAGATKLIRETKDVLCRLASKVPWLTGKFSRTNIANYLHDVLQYHRTLMYDVQKQHSVQDDSEDDNVGADTQECTLNGDNLNSIQNEHRKTVPEVDETESNNSVGNSDTGNYKRPSSDSSNGLDVGNKKRKVSEDVFLPLRYKINRQKSKENQRNQSGQEEKPFVYLGDIDSCELNEYDITDEELKEYLRSEEQLKVVAHLYK